ncbi:MAG: hypothetical protein ACPGLV_04090 [Bacteroidia bacterium]
MNKLSLLFIFITILSCKQSSINNEKSEIVINAKELQIDRDSVLDSLIITKTKSVIEPDLVTQIDTTTTTLDGVYKVRLFDVEENEYDTMVNITFLKNILFRLLDFKYPKFMVGFSDSNRLSLLRENIDLHIETSFFDSSKCQIDFSTNGVVKSINGEGFWGTDGFLPKMQYEQFIIYKNENKLNLLDQVFNLFEPNIDCHNDDCYTNAYLTEKGEIIIWATNSDGAGGYDLILIIDKNLELSHKIVGFGF